MVSPFTLWDLLASNNLYMAKDVVMSPIFSLDSLKYSNYSRTLASKWAIITLSPPMYWISNCKKI